MFGVLVVRDSQNRLGYLSSYSGTLNGQWIHPDYVPPILTPEHRSQLQSLQQEKKSSLSKTLQLTQQNPEFHRLKQRFAELKHQSVQTLETLRQELKQRKQARKQQRQQQASSEHLKTLAEESIADKLRLKNSTELWAKQLQETEKLLQQHESRIADLNNQLLDLDEGLSQAIFSESVLTNAAGHQCSISQLFPQQLPLAGTGDCAAPKLLNYANQHQFQPIALAEFWWGDSPEAEVRRHGRCYPPCRGKCGPLLPYMLEGLRLDKPELLGSGISEGALTTVYEDDAIVVLDKPAGLLSVPGNRVTDSVLTRLQQRYPKATGPILVHRLDLSTSGLLIAAKNADAHKTLQKQFIDRNIQKRYVALLEGTLKDSQGLVDLPLRIDFDDRPRQVVCDIYGKSAQTRWEVVERSNNQTRVHFYPLTGRTHQLRLHAAHQQGLGHPIVGDELYGLVGDRLCLHAEKLTFQHPTTKRTLTVTSETMF